MPIQFLIKKIMFRPVKLKPDYIFQFNTDFEEINFYPEPEVSINALHFKVNNPNGIILYFHGNKDNLARWGTIASELTRFNYDVVAIDYRGYGKSTGSFSEDNFFKDALYCYSKLKETFNPKEIIIFGRSLGSGIAACLAFQINSSKLILETPYYDMHDLVGNYFPSFLFKNKLNYKFSSHTYLKHSGYPILIFHGTNDGTVPYRSGIKLFESIDNPRKRFVTIRDGKHNNLNSFQTYWEELQKFLEQSIH